ncbi:bifunctional 4-hydroxy-2-oxoglutarate aldolase/2-dehydro-3-deoxy-phosphogluconate aldolase [Alkalihalobacillus sp. AL-G]|uniref:bifunctional 4-hydroxy-2-oxoglutarate aldolase/2-dehydro-3-deoxy-phosphogluconate aldolase n=1 Tax=Alkalihalobacillus sp. AL-G TaxID=2926399 RepID=UPI00272BC626|nr:bifunctional 4-hydroxy-2-oxoglutarate aldolase/2-dehydro-3-deoxy-phosphogluconate aldolase [Alkalihalobacillus sp. AL-G]WLD93334.1 bifunctional 4-hydroxy-2-oxoglutarate aldolase/2-dehydro-3-deoxy-phosphogluconate aldolase [Alkalihalobacillus sp. AL-G]
MSVISEIKENKIVAVIREADVQTIEPIVGALYNGGVKVIELTAETKNITAIIDKVVQSFGDRIIVGAGTVLDPETARSVIMAGAQFIVSPTLNLETIKLTKRYGVVCIPGSLTPTEILTAYEHGADMIKIFPANAFGPAYIKSIHGPLPSIPLMVTGGINLENMNDYLNQGGVAVGIGSNLVDCKKLKTENDFSNLTKNAAKYVSKLKEVNV